MNMWTSIFAGIVFFTLGSALEDAGVYVNGTYSQGKFHTRVWPTEAGLLCTLEYFAIEWFRISQWERLVQGYASGNNYYENATISFGTPSLQIVYVTPNESATICSCKYLPAAYRNVTVRNRDIINLSYSNMQYFAVKVNNTEQATMKKGFNYVKNLVQNRFQNKSGMNPAFMAVEMAASGQVYVGVMKDFKI